MDTEEREATKIEMTAKTAQALRDAGGMLYVWAPGGLPRARTIAPATPTDFEAFHGDGWFVYVDRTIAPPTRWVIKRKRFPWPRFLALYDPPEWELGGIGDIVAGWAEYS